MSSGHVDFRSKPSREEFRRFYDEHATFVCCVLKRLSVPPSYLDDAMQEVLVIAHRKLPELLDPTKVRGWLLSICVRVEKDHRRLAHVRREVLCEEPIGPVPDDTFLSPEAQAQAREDRVLLEQVLSKLDENQRTVFVFHVLYDMTGEEIAMGLDWPLGTVYSRIRAARATVRRVGQALMAMRGEGRNMRYDDSQILQTRPSA